MRVVLDTDYSPQRAQLGKVDYLVSGHRRGVLALKSHGVTRIVPARVLRSDMDVASHQ